MHPIILYEIAKERQRDLLREAEHYRLVKQARAGQPNAFIRLLEKLRCHLINLRYQLQMQNIQPCTETLDWAEQ